MFISSSNKPVCKIKGVKKLKLQMKRTLEEGVEVFIEDLVCLPVYITTPTTEPEAITVFAQAVFSIFKDSSTILLIPSSSSSF